MDKNMIDIDDLFRQRMQGREEVERAGAWSRMSELLDKNEETKPVAFGWKRFAGVLAGLVLVSAISVGSYTVLNHAEKESKEENTGATGNSFAANTPSGNNTTPMHPETAAGKNTAHHNSSVAVAAAINTNTKNNTDLLNNKSEGTNTNNNTQWIADNNSINNQPANKPSANNSGNIAHKINVNKVSNTNIAATSNAHKTHNNTIAGNTTKLVANTTTNSKSTSDTTSNPAPDNNIGNTGTANADKVNIVANGTDADDNNQPVNSRNADGSTSGSNAIVPASGRSTVAANAAKRNNSRVARVMANHAKAIKHTNTNLNNGNNFASISGANASLAATNATQSTVVAKGKIKIAKRRNSGNTANRSNTDVQNLPLAAAKSAATHSSMPPKTTTVAAAGSNSAQGNSYIRRDTIARVSIIQHTVVDPYSHKRYTTIDTESIEKILVERSIPFAMSIAPQVNPATPLMLPNAAPAAAANADAGDNIVPLANYKVEGKKKKWNPEIFAQVFESAKMNIAQAKMYPGISAGVNSFFTQGLMPGLHFGINNEIVFNERWSIMTELKYLTNFNNGKTINDDYITGPNAVYTVYNGASPIGNMYERDSVKHSFKFSGYGSLNLPISIRYSVKRLFFGAGVNFIYNFGVNTEEIKQSYTIKEMVPLDKPAPDYLTRIGAAKISTSDFSSRFGVGYLFNAGYNISPAFSADVRIMQTFWDNAGSTGAGRVSSQLYKAPGMQFSVNYRFGQNSH